MPSAAKRRALEEKAARVPKGPGIYQFKSERGTVLYVGKAQNLRVRIRQYLAGGDGRLQIPALMERVADLEVLVTANVKEALLLENELIKRHKPVFNVKLRDDKQYLGLRLDLKEEWPRVGTVRRFRRDGALYFGPYTSSVGLKESLSNLRRLFPLRSCSAATFQDYARRGRPCIEFEMGRCLGPCCGLAERAAYDEQVRGTMLFLKGRSEQLVRRLTDRMQEAAEGERFEEAARLRDRITAVETTLESQQIVSNKSRERDVFGLAREGGEVNVQVLQVREGRVMGAEDYAFSHVQLDDGAVLSSFLGQYYAGREDREPPREILASSSVEDPEVLVDWLRERSRHRVRIQVPQRGAIRQLVEIATRNARLGLEQRLLAKESLEAAMEEIERACKLACRPHRIECYDVSNFQGTLAVASRVVFFDGQPEKKDYRKYRIREAEAGDDYACLREVLHRRLDRVSAEPLPDLLMVDGGRGQLAVVTALLADRSLSVETLGISKERDEESTSRRVKRSGGLKAERLYRPGRKNPILLPISSRGLLLLQRVRDESHRFAIEYQRSLRSRLGMISILEELPGIGPGKRRNLLRSLGSLKAIREADVEALRNVPGISARDAETLHGFFSAGNSIGEG